MCTLATGCALWRASGCGAKITHNVCINTAIIKAVTISTATIAPDWPTLFRAAPPLDVPPAILLGILLAACALSIPRATWQYFGLFATLVHELGHAVAAMLTARMLHGIRLHRDHSGDAVTSGRGTRGTLGTVISGLFGYPAPAIVGAAQLWSVFHGYTAIALFAGGVVLVLTLLVIRNLFGVLVVAASAVVSAALWFYAPPTVQGYALLVLGTALLVGSVRGLATVVGVHVPHRDRLRTSDAYLLYRRTGIPSVIWLALFTVLIGAAAAAAVATTVAAVRSPG
jgi:hypothetical protein